MSSDTASLSDVCGECGIAWDQGDIVDGIYFAAFDSLAPAVLLTPACDIAHDKVENWTFVALFSDVEVAAAITKRQLADWKASNVQLSNKQKDALKKALQELVTQRVPRYHWIPIQIGHHIAHVADFSFVTSIPVKEVKEQARRIATLRSSWREQLPARYASYMARVGTHDIEPGEMSGHIQRLLGSMEDDSRNGGP